jgi:lipid A 3-O-deacylase
MSMTTRHDTTIELEMIGKGTLRCLATIIVVGAASGCLSGAMAQEDDRWRFRQFQIENDDVFPIPFSEPSDRFYTNGIRISFARSGFHPATDIDSLPAWARAIRRRCAGCRIYPGIFVGQSLYTPERIDIAGPQPGERPWAAWLYGSFGVAIYSRGDRARHDIEIQLGVTGDAAGGEWLQERWHRLINAPEPEGWDQQFDSEIGINALYTYQRILRWSDRRGIVDWDFVPSFKAAVGTISDYAGVGATVRIGRNISDFPYTPISPSEMRSVPARLGNLEIYGFVGADVRAVAHNYFLEGSFFDDDAGTVDPKTFVWDFSFGVTVRFRRNNITYAVVRRSEEFERTSGNDRGIHSFGSLSITRGIR